MKNDRQNIVLGEAQPIKIKRSDIQNFAERISSEYELTKFKDDGSDPLFEFVEKLGGRIHYQNPPDFVTSESGSIKVWAENDFAIYLSTFTGPLRDRFTVAHELGHYFLHSKQGKNPIKASRKGSGQVEWEANWFAGALLMPKQEFEKIREEYGNDSYSIAGRFMVSVKATEIRIQQLAYGQ